MINRAFLLSTVVVTLSSGLVAAAYTLATFPYWLMRDLMWEEQVASGMCVMPQAAAGLGVLFAGVAYVMRRRGVQSARWLSQGPWISATLLLIGTLLLLAPVSGFHHMYQFGLLGYMILDCDSPPEGLPISFGNCGLRGSGLELALTLVLWLAFVLSLAFFLRRRSAQ